MSKAVELLNVSKAFGAVKALDEINLGFGKGEVVAFLGPNGAGKSTLLRIVSAQIMPTAGTVKVFGVDALREPEEVKRNVGFVGHRSFLYDELTVEENLSFYGSFLEATSEDLDRVIRIADIDRWRGVKAGHLSYGLKKRSDIARALLGNPGVLVLDELFSGLDVEISGRLVKYFLSDQRERTILVSSHSMAQVREFCSRGVHLMRGRIERDVGL